MDLIITNHELTMSTREIAELLGKAHSNIKVCVRCRREGHLSHACKEPNPKNHKSESPCLREQTRASINADNLRKPA